MSTDNSRRARIAEGLPNPWVNKHKNVSQKFERLYSVANPPPPSCGRERSSAPTANRRRRPMWSPSPAPVAATSARRTAR